MTDVGTIANQPCSNALRVNSGGQAVGRASDCFGGALRAFLWENGTITDLNAFVPPGSNLTLEQALYISDRGEIAGDASLPNGDTHAFLLIPDGDCDSDCEGRIAASQNNAALAQNAATTKQGSESLLSPVERFRSQMRQRYHIPGQPAAPRD